MAAVCDVFVMDAFGTAHRAQASTHGVAKYAPRVCAGLLLDAELKAFQQALASPATPMVAIIGGAKVSTKLEVLGSLASIADRIIVGGGIANTFIAAAGYEVGSSLHEPDLVSAARQIAEQVDIPIPVDVMVAKAFAADAVGVVKAIDAVHADEMILDIGPVTARAWANSLMDAQTIMWNGPVGVFEFPQFGRERRAIGEAIAESEPFRLPAVAIRWQLLSSTGWRMACPISQPEVAHFWSWLRARPCLRLLSWVSEAARCKGANTDANVKWNDKICGERLWLLSVCASFWITRQRTTTACQPLTSTI